MQAQREAPPDMQCKDKFLVQSVVTTAGAAVKDITPEMVLLLFLFFSPRSMSTSAYRLVGE